MSTVSQDKTNRASRLAKAQQPITAETFTPYSLVGRPVRLRGPRPGIDFHSLVCGIEQGI